MSELSRRLGTGLLAAGVSLTTLTGLTTLSAHAATSAGTRASAVAGEDLWFVDPLSSADRAREIAVPAHPGRLDGQRLRPTTARLRTHAGGLAVPATQAVGHQLITGQAVTVPGTGFEFGGSRLNALGRQQIKQLRASLTEVGSLRCEGYANYSRTRVHANQVLSAHRAATVCDALTTGRDDLTTRARGYGGSTPVVVGGSTSTRSANRRVVVIAAAPVSVKLGPVQGLEVHFGDGTMLVSFDAPATGSSTGYEYTTDGGTTWADLHALGSSELFAIVPGLVNGTTYHVAVRAIDASGHGPASRIVTGVPHRVSTTPGAPTITEALPGDHSAVLSIHPPSETGSDPVTGYEYTTNGTDWSPLSTTGTGPVQGTVTGLSNGTAYQVSVRAVSAAGPGDASAAETVTPVAPAAVPDAVSLDPGSVEPGDGSATVTFSSPADNGSAIDGFEYTVDGGLTWATLSVTDSDPLVGTITGLTNGTEYTVAVRAVNSVGAGAASSGRTVTPAGAPRASAPTVGFAHFHSESIVHFQFTVPDDDGGSPITGYQASFDGGAWLDAGDRTNVTMDTYLTDGNTCPSVDTVTVRAVTADGPGAASEPYTFDCD